MIRGFWAGGACWTAAGRDKVAAVLADGSEAHAWGDREGVHWSAGPTGGFTTGEGTSLFGVCGMLGREARERATKNSR